MTTFEIGVIINPQKAVPGIDAIDRKLSGLDASAAAARKEIEKITAARDAGANATIQAIRDRIGEVKARADAASASARQVGAGIDDRGIKRVNAELGRTKSIATDVGSTIRAAFGGIVAALGVREFVRLSDELSNVQNRLRLVTDGESDLIDTQSELFAIADRSRVSFESTATIFTRLAQNQDQLGRTSQQLLSFTESLNQAVILSGASATEASAGLIQLSQGMSAGALRGDELRSVLEQLPGVARVIAKDLGVSTGELRKLGEQGAITAEVILGAFERAGPELARQFSTTIPTIGQSFAVLRNDVVAFTGAINESTGIAGSFAQSIGFVSESLREFTTVLAEASQAPTKVTTAFGEQGAAIVSIQKELTRLNKTYEEGGRTNEVAAERIRRLKADLDALTGAARQTVQVEKARVEAGENVKALTEKQEKTGRDLIAELNEESRLLQLSTEERKIAVEVLKAEAELKKAGVDISRAQGAAIRDEAEAIIRANAAREEANEAREKEAAVARKAAADAEKDEEKAIVRAEKERERLIESIDVQSKNRDKRAELLLLREEELDLIPQIDKALQDLTLAELEASTALEDGFSRAFLKIQREADDLAAVGESITDAFVGEGLSAIDQFVETGKFRIKDFTASVLEDLAKILAKAALLQFISVATGGGGSLLSLLGTGAGQNAGRAGGGTVQPGQLPFPVGERGPELFAPNQTGTIIPAAQAQQRPEVRVAVVVVNNEDAARDRIASGDYDDVILHRMGANSDKVRQLAAG